MLSVGHVQKAFFYFLVGKGDALSTTLSDLLGRGPLLNSFNNCLMNMFWSNFTFFGCIIFSTLTLFLTRRSSGHV